jgi:hypothetical protein
VLGLGATRDWKLQDKVWLNPERNQPEDLKKAAGQNATSLLTTTGSKVL